MNDLGLDKNRVYITYCAGGNVQELTAGKYAFDFQIPEDKISKEAFLEVGVPEENLIADRSRDTFLALHVYDRASPWGYRNEINFNVGTKENPVFLDIATLEYGRWRPIFKDRDESKFDNTIGLIEPDCGFFINVFGLERLCMAANGLRKVRDVDYIKPFYDEMKRQNESEDVLAGESLRALHRIYSDIENYKCVPGRHQNKKINHLLSYVYISLTNNDLGELLKLHAEMQPWHDNLKNGIEPTLERIKAYRKSRK